MLLHDKQKNSVN